MFFISGIWTSSLYKLYHFGAVKLGLISNWKGSGGTLHTGGCSAVCPLLLSWQQAGCNGSSVTSRKQQTGGRLVVHCAGTVHSVVGVVQTALWVHEPFKPLGIMAATCTNVVIYAVVQTTISGMACGLEQWRCPS